LVSFPYDRKFLGCAGERDTGGVIARVINALIKSAVTSNVE